MTEALERDIEAQVEQLGYELVEMEHAGSKTRPVLRLRIDRVDSEAGSGVTLDDCGRVSRALEAYLEERGDIPARYVLEVSSPGIERPLVRPRDFERFRGREVAVIGKAPLHDGAKRIEGDLLGIGEDGRVRVRLGDGAELAIDREEIKRVHLVYRWDGEGDRKA